MLKRAPRTLLKSFAVSKELETVYEKYKIKDGTNSSINFRWEEPRVGLVNEVQIKNVNEVESVADKTLPDIARIKDKTLADIARIKVAETELDTKVARVVSVNVKVPKQQSEISQVKKALIAKKVDPVNKEDKKHKVQIKNGKNFFAAAFKVTETLQEKVCMLSSMQSKAFKVLDLKEDLKEEWTVVVRRNRSRTGRIMRI